MTPAPTGTDVGLSARLREQTRQAHEHAESASFVRDLLDGRLPLAAYTALVAQNHAIYRALERAAEQWRGHDVAGRLVLDELVRGPQLEADLAALLGAEWSGRSAALVLSATERYAAHLATNALEVFVANHYVRYLGDLSGGQVLRAGVTRVYGERAAVATAFYTFAGIGRIKPFKDRYRALVDGLALTPAQESRTVEEAVVAFQLNRDVFDELGRRYPPTSTAEPAAG